MIYRMDPQKEQEFAHHSMRYKRYQQSSSRVGMVYIFLFGLAAVGAVFLDFLFGGERLFIHTLLFMATGGLGIAGIYKQNTLMLGFSCAASLVNCMFGLFGVVLMPAAIGLAVRSFFLNREYKYLSQQEGFPTFSVLQAEHDANGSADKFEEQKKQFQSRYGDTGGKMEEL